MKPYDHGRVSVKKWGGRIEDYQEIHDFLDSTKAFIPDMRHRAILHNAWGIYMAERVFGVSFKNSDGKVCHTRDVAEQHVIDDLGTIPTLQDYLTHLPHSRLAGWSQAQERHLHPAQGAEVDHDRSRGGSRNQ
jgi:hypothetical protein